MIKLSHPAICPYCQSGYLLPSEIPEAPPHKCNSCSTFVSEWEKKTLGRGSVSSEIPEGIEKTFLSNGWSWGNLMSPTDPGLFYSDGEHRILLIPIENKWKACWIYKHNKEQLSVLEEDPFSALKKLYGEIQEAFDSFPWEINLPEPSQSEDAE